MQCVHVFFHCPFAWCSLMTFWHFFFHSTLSHNITRTLGGPPGSHHPHSSEEPLASCKTETLPSPTVSPLVLESCVLPSLHTHSLNDLIISCDFWTWETLSFGFSQGLRLSRQPWHKKLSMLKWNLISLPPTDIHPIVLMLMGSKNLGMILTPRMIFYYNQFWNVTHICLLPPLSPSPGPSPT